MALEITITGRTATTVSISMAGKTGISAQLQICPDPSFSLCSGPIFTSAPGTTQTIPGLNQDSVYYMRGRNILAGPIEEEWGATQAFHTPVDTPWAEETGAIRIEPAILAKPITPMALAASNEVAGFPASNAFFPAPFVPWRSAMSEGLHWIRFRAGFAPIDVLAALGTNLPEATTVTITADNDSGNLSSTPDFTRAFPAFRASPNVPGRPSYHGLFRLDEPQSYDWWQIAFSAALPGGVLEVDHIVAGLNLATKPHAVDRKESPLDLGSLSRSRSGQPIRQAGVKLRRHEFEIAMLRENEFEQHYGQMWRWLNQTMLVVPNAKPGPYLHDRLAYGDFVSTPFTQVSSTRYTRSFIIESLI